MRLLLVCVLCLPAWLCLTSSTPSQEKLIESPYYPLKVGSRWIYRSGGRTIDVRVVKHESVGDLTCARVEAGEGEQAQVEYLTAKADGIYRCKVNKEDVEPPLLVLKLPPKAGETWTISSKVGDREARGKFTIAEGEVTVPAGKYKAVTVTCDDFQVGGERLGLTYWFAESVGMVKQSIRVGGGEVVLELEKFQPGQ